MLLGGGGGEIPKGGRAGRARFLGIWPGGGEITGGQIPGTPDRKYLAQAHAVAESEIFSFSA